METFNDKNHSFWSVQPIVYNKNNNQYINRQISYIDLYKTQQTPHELPNNMEWYNIDINKSEDIDELYIFLLNNYVTDINETLRFAYPKEFLIWFLNQPGYINDLHIGIKHNNILIACIFGIPLYTNIFGKIINQVEINLLCVHKDLRKFRIAQILIEEVIRRTKFNMIWAAIYSGTQKLPHSICKVDYYHYPLNISKLMDIKFINNPYKSVYKSTINSNVLIELIKDTDIKECCNKLNDFLIKYKINRCFSYAQFKHHFICNNKNIIESYIIKKDGKITDFISFYYLPSLILNNKKHKVLNKGYLYYYFNNDIKLVDLVIELIKIMKKKKIDVIDCINIMDYNTVINELNFIQGTGTMDYYLYNWECEPIKSYELGVFMV